MAAPEHVPVMTREVVDLLRPDRGGLYVDCTVGLGGHSQALLEAGATKVIGLDRDREALDAARASLERWGERVELIHTDYRDLRRVLVERSISGVDGALADLGVSSLQLDAEGRGFSFRRDEPLDMRMDRTKGATAAELLRDIDEGELADIIFEFGEERFSRRIARAIVGARRESELRTTAQLAQLVRRAVPRKGYQRIDPATRTFQALRIRVNRELDGLDAFLSTAAEVLRAGARLAVISFHSLEDRIVKRMFRALERPRNAESDPGESALRIVTKRPLVPGDAEVDSNPRARSAKLRAIERVA
jgi:16S rRNA (cytosine1402-N4)-methyltransferase